MPWEKLARTTHHLMCALDRAGVVTEVNEAWSSQLGHPKGGVAGRHLSEMVKDEDQGALSEALASALDTGEAVVCTVRVVRSDGVYAWIEWSMSAVDGEVYAIGVDVTLRRERESERTEEHNLLELFEEKLGLGRWRYDITTGRRSWTNTVTELYGRGPDVEVDATEDGLEFYHPDDREMIAEKMRVAVQYGEPFEFQARVIRQGEETRWVESSGLVVKSSEGEPRVIHGLLRDVTEQRERTERMMHTERLAAIGQMAAGVAHEVNNPLQYTLTHIELLREEFEEATPDTLEMIANALEGVRRVRTIVDTLRKFSRSSSGEPERYAPVQLINSTTRLLAKRHVEQVDVEIEAPEDLPEVEIEEQTFSQCLLNLLTNACQAATASGRRGVVTVSAAVEVVRGHEHVIFVVADDGPGLTPEAAARTFEPFFTTKPSGEGTGLGLSITRTLIESCGGSVTLSNKADGRGAVATLTLPCAARAEEAEEFTKPTRVGDG